MAVKNTANLGAAMSRVRSDPNMGNPGGTFGKGAGKGGGQAVGYNPNGTKAPTPGMGPAPAPHRKA